MTIETRPTGGFIGDPAEAFAPPAASGCCGTAPASGASDAGAQAAGSPCCGTAAAAEEAGSCCAPSAKADAVAAGTGCCG